MGKRPAKKLFSRQSPKQTKTTKFGPPGPASYPLSKLTSYDARNARPVANFFGNVPDDVPLLSFDMPDTPLVETKLNNASGDENEDNSADDHNESSESEESGLIECEDEPSFPFEPPQAHPKADKRASRHEERANPKTKKFLSSRATGTLESYIKARIRDFPNEPFENCQNKKLFCKACREDLGNVDRVASIRLHTTAPKHTNAILAQLKAVEREKEIEKYLHTRSEQKMISLDQRVYRLKVAGVLLYCGIPFEALGHESCDNKLRSLIEGNGFRLGTESLMSDQVPEVRDMHFKSLQPLFQPNPTSHIFDGACVTVNSLCMVSRTLHLDRGNPPERNSFRIVQRLTNVSLIMESPTGPTMAGYIQTTINDLGEEKSGVVYWAALFQPSSAAAERVFGVMNLISGQQKAASEDKLTTSAMLRINDDGKHHKMSDEDRHRRINENVDVSQLQLPKVRTRGFLLLAAL